jgi:hypothetical protein
MISCPPLSHNSAVFTSRKSDTLSWLPEQLRFF